MLEKVYAVEFMVYTNCLNDTVSDWDGKGSPEIGKIKYLDVKGKNVFLIKESDLEKYRKYGQGYKNLTCIGWMEIDEPKKVTVEGPVSFNDCNTYTSDLIARA